MLKYLVFVFTFNTLGRLPLPVLYGLMSFMAWVAYYVVRGARRNIEQNLRHVMPKGAKESEVRRTAQRILENVAFYYADLARLPRMDIDDFFRRRLVYKGVEEHLRPAIREGKGVIMLTSHFGNPEMAMQGLIPLGIPAFAVTEPLHPRLSKFLDEVRGSKGHEFAPVNVGSVKKIMRKLKEGDGIVALMGDRDIKGPKMLLPFCGVETMMPTGPIEVALRAGAVVIPAFSMRRSRYVMVAEAEERLKLERTGDMASDVRAGALEYLERYERRLRADPGQWAVLEAIWDTPVAGGGTRTGLGGGS